MQYVPTLKIKNKNNMTTNKISLLLLCSVFFCIAANAQLKFVESAEFPLFGKISDETETRYERLPASLRGVSRDPVWDLGKNTAGLFIRFASNSSTIGLQWTVLNNFRMNHMTDTGIRGFDLYTYEDGKWWFVNSARPRSSFDNEAIIIRNMTNEMREFKLYFPLYDGVTALRIGVDSAAIITPPQENRHFTQRLPIIYYGTSLTQGGCASRPGMAHTNILSRWLNTEIINLGFSGNGQLDFEIAEIIAQREASLIVIDCIPNCTRQQVLDRLEKFIEIVRAGHPDVTILLVEQFIFTHARFDRSSYQALREKNEAVHEVFNRIVERGDRNIYLIPASEIKGLDGEATVDGVHFTDLGFMRFAEFLYPIIRKHLN